MCGTDKYLKMKIVEAMDLLDQEVKKQVEVDENLYYYEQNLMQNDLFALLITSIEMENFPIRNNSGKI